MMKIACVFSLRLLLLHVSMCVAAVVVRNFALVTLLTRAKYESKKYSSYSFALPKTQRLADDEFSLFRLALSRMELYVRSVFQTALMRWK